MTEIYTIVGTGIAITGITLASIRRLGSRIDRRIDRFEDRLEDRLSGVERGQAELRERMAKLEGLREAITGRRAA